MRAGREYEGSGGDHFGHSCEASQAVREEQREPKARLSLSYSLPFADQVTLSVQLELCLGYTWLATVHIFTRSNRRERLHLPICSVVPNPPSPISFRRQSLTFRSDLSARYKPPRCVCVSMLYVLVMCFKIRKMCHEVCACVLARACFSVRVCVCVCARDVRTILVCYPGRLPLV